MSELHLSSIERTLKPRIYILDTNVLLYDPGALRVFKSHDLVIPMTVIEEIDSFKRDMSEIGHNARTISRMLDGLRSKGSLKDGVSIAEGCGNVQVAHSYDEPDVPINWGAPTNDNRILATVLRLHREHKGNVAFVTRDTNMRLKCDALGIVAEDYQNARIEVDVEYTGVTSLSLSEEDIDTLNGAGHLVTDVSSHLYPHQFVTIEGEGDSKKTALGRVMGDGTGLQLVGRHKDGAWGVFARNKEQLFALDLLLDSDLSLVTINGFAGSGKTLLAMAAGLRNVGDDRKYRKLLVSRPIFPLGKDIGFLPGDIGEKLNPWMKPIFDNLEFLLTTRRDRETRAPGREPVYQHLIDQNILEVEPLTYIRGRSIPNQFLIVDEAQNLTPHEAKTVLTRAGEGTKVIMTGDPNQIDNPYVDALSNGLTYTIERFKSSSLAGHITLKKGERSELAETAAHRL